MSLLAGATCRFAARRLLVSGPVGTRPPGTGPARIRPDGRPSARAQSSGTEETSARSLAAGTRLPAPRLFRRSRLYRRRLYRRRLVPAQATGPSARVADLSSGPGPTPMIRVPTPATRAITAVLSPA